MIDACRATPRWPRRCICSSLPRSPGVASHPRLSAGGRRGSQLTLIEDYVALHAGSLFHQRGDRGRVGRAMRRSPMCACSAKAARPFISPVARCRSAPPAATTSVSVALGARISRLRSQGAADGRGREVHARRPGADRRRASWPTPTRFIDHAKPHGISRQLHKCIVGGARARGVQRQDHGAPRRATDRFGAVQPQPAAVRQGARRHQAAARDFCRRREMRARRHRRPARQRRGVLPAKPRLVARRWRAIC